MRRVLGFVLALCVALVALAGAFVTSSGVARYLDRQDASHDAQRPAEAPEHRDSMPADGESSSKDHTDDAAEEVEALPAYRASNEGSLRQSDVTSTTAQRVERWLNIETPPPRE